MSDLVIAITGASGAIYAVRLLEVLLSTGRSIHLTISPSAVQVIHQELGLHVDLDNFEPDQLLPADADLAEDSKLYSLRSSAGTGLPKSSIFSDSEIEPGALWYHHHADFSAGIASGSFLTAGMVICPCSMGTVASIAGGLSTNLIHRAADVHLKERRKLILVPRETPLGRIHLQNLLRLTESGAIVLPAMPGFYHNPTSLHDLIDFVVGRICDQLDIRQEMVDRWGSE